MDNCNIEILQIKGEVSNKQKKLKETNVEIEKNGQDIFRLFKKKRLKKS